MKTTVLFQRRCCQIGTALAFIAIPFLNLRNITVLFGNFLSFNMAGLPLADPLAVLQTLAAGFPAFVSLAGAGASLLISLVLGRIFCSWICPYGFFSEILHTLGKNRRRKGAALPDPVSSSQAGRLKNSAAHASACRFFVASTGMLAVLFFLPGPFLNQLSMPGWYSRALQQGIFSGVLLVGALCLPCMLFLEAVSGKRLWCRWLCPQSVLIALAASFPRGLKVRFSPKKCSCGGNDRPCLSACSLEINPRAETTVQRLACTNCGDCVDACRGRGKALTFSFRADQ
ncbi:MAG: 4Fe-4S binding protein [Desulfovibrio sp.]|jgi:ferredoxin-type protein NapH|nr:4Fe-4S binding protein [Desulfovibrio sp.]